MAQMIDKNRLHDVLEQAFEKFRNDDSGKNADYIPYLASVNSSLFGIAATLPDGTTLTVGDCDYAFGIESVSKVPTALLAMNQHSADEVLDKIGADATGLPFNSIMAILLENDHPSTPLVNAGAISACSMILPAGNATQLYRGVMRLEGRGYRRTLQIGECNQLQQSLDSVATAQLRADIR